MEYSRNLTLPLLGDSIAYPSSVAADRHTGEMFVCDPRRNRVLIFDPEGFLSFELNGGNVFSGPFDIAVDPEGFLLVLANYEDRRTILELDFDGLFLGEIVLVGLPEGLLEPRLTSLALSPGGDRIYVLDPANMRAWIVDREGSVQSSIDLAVGLTEEQRRETRPQHVDVYENRVLIGFPRVGTVRACDLDGKLTTTVGAFGAGECELLFPVAAAIDAGGNFIVVDKHRMVISIWSPERNRCRRDHFGFGIRPGLLYFPTDLALDAGGKIYVSQPYEGRIQVYERSVPLAAQDEPR